MNERLFSNTPPTNTEMQTNAASALRPTNTEMRERETETESERAREREMEREREREREREEGGSTEQTDEASALESASVWPAAEATQQQVKRREREEEDEEDEEEEEGAGGEEEEEEEENYRYTSPSAASSKRQDGKSTGAGGRGGMESELLLSLAALQALSVKLEHRQVRQLPLPPPPPPPPNGLLKCMCLIAASCSSGPPTASLSACVSHVLKSALTCQRSASSIRPHTLVA
jgi:hypothetical protein